MLNTKPATILLITITTIIFYVLITYQLNSNAHLALKISQDKLKLIQIECAVLEGVINSLNNEITSLPSAHLAQMNEELDKLNLTFRLEMQEQRNTFILLAGSLFELSQLIDSVISLVY